MKRVIVTTTINPPTKALHEFSKMKDWVLVVVGDKKTPHEKYKNVNCIYLSPKDQERMDKTLSDLIGWNCIQRRNFGFLYAYKELYADIIATVDDDNIPYTGWGRKILIGDTAIPWVTSYEEPLEVFDPISVTEYNHLWHRGFPIQLVSKRKQFKKLKKIIKRWPFEIQADFWNGDPDVDAICRSVYDIRCNFNRKIFPFTCERPSPFNSQNTFLLRKVIPYYFMFPHIGRMDDIWASYYVQGKAFRVVYNKPTVVQDRNEHSLIEDMKKEMIGYEHSLDLIRSLRENSENIQKFLPEKSWQAFMQYRRHFE